MKKWLWEYEQYPSFPYQAESLINVIDNTSQNIGKLSTLIEILDQSKENNLAMETFIEESSNLWQCYYGRSTNGNGSDESNIR